MSRLQQILKSLELRKLDLSIILKTLESDGLATPSRKAKHRWLLAEYDSICAQLDLFKTVKTVA